MLSQLRGWLLAASRYFRQQYLLIGILVGLMLQSIMGRAQQQADLVGWTCASVQWQPDSGRWALEISPNYVTYQNLTRTFLRLGLGRVSYAWPRQRLSLSLLYEVGPADQRGTLQLARLYLSQELTTRRVHPRWQLSLDRLWFTPKLFENQERQPIYRVRTLVGIVPPLGHHLSLVLTTEPFVYRTTTCLQEVRSQVGLQFAPRTGITVQALYWNWWAGYEPRRVRWQHTVLLTATFHLSKTPWHEHRE